MKYVVYKDYKRGLHHLGYEYITIEAKDKFEVICIAEEMWRKEEDKLYLMRIMEKEGTVFSDINGWKAQAYLATICKRSKEVGWHKNDEEHCEGAHTIVRHYKKDMEWF